MGSVAEMSAPNASASLNVTDPGCSLLTPSQSSIAVNKVETTRPGTASMRIEYRACQNSAKSSLNAPSNSNPGSTTRNSKSFVSCGPEKEVTLLRASPAMISKIAYGMRTRADRVATAAAMASRTKRLISRWTNARGSRFDGYPSSITTRRITPRDEPNVPCDVGLLRRESLQGVKTILPEWRFARKSRCASAIFRSL